MRDLSAGPRSFGSSAMGWSLSGGNCDIAEFVPYFIGHQASQELAWLPAWIEQSAPRDL